MNETYQKSLLKLGIDNPYIVNDVIELNPAILFKDEIYRKISYILIKYYSSTNEPITMDYISSNLAKTVDRENKKAETSGNHIVTDEEFTNSYLAKLSDLFNEKVNFNSKFIEELELEIKDALASSAILDEASKGNENLSSRVSERLDTINSITLQPKTNAISVFTDLQEKEDIYETDFKNERLDSGLKDLDSLVSLQRGQIALVGANSGSGKTTFLSSLACYYALRSKLNVLYITLEELQSKMTVTFDRLIMGKKSSDIFLPNSTINKNYIQENKQFFNAVKSKSKGNITFLCGSPNTVSVEQLENLINETEREKKTKYDVIILDYADILKKSDTGNESIEGERIFQNLVSLAKRKDVLLWTATQLNRMSKQTDVKTLDSIEGSYRKLNVCAFAMTLNQTKEEFEHGYIRFYIDKIRDRYKQENVLIDNCLYFKIDLDTLKITNETKAERAEHEGLLSTKNKTNVDYKQVAMERKQEKEDISLFNNSGIELEQ